MSKSPSPIKPVKKGDEYDSFAQSSHRNQPALAEPSHADDDEWNSLYTAGLCARRHANVRETVPRRVRSVTHRCRVACVSIDKQNSNQDIVPSSAKCGVISANSCF